MTPFWTISALDVMHLRSPGGDAFTQFMDALIRTQASLRSIPVADVRSNLRTTLPDGGVDTEVRRESKADSSGWLAQPSSWQFKATEARNLSKADLRDEIAKPYSRNLIEQGYGYRLCVCDDIPPERQAEWEAILLDAARSINASAPAPLVLTASTIAAAASRFPALAAEFFKPQTAKALHLSAWKKNITRVTPHFVDVDAWSSTKRRIIEHVDFRQPTATTLSVQGEAGVGKTRLVFETLSAIEGAAHLALYTADEAAADQLAYSLANDSSVAAILVADECSLQKRLQLRATLSGHAGRVRVITIDNSGDRPSSPEPELWLEKIPRDTVERILEANFPRVPHDRRRAYADLSSGFVRLAADLCEYDSKIEAAGGDTAPALASVREYMRARLGGPYEMKTVAAVAFVSKVGFRGDVSHELDVLCDLLNLDRSKIVETADRLKDAPGFVGRGGRYYYITPEIVAQVAFAEAWRRSGAADPSAFLAKMPESLLSVFLTRVSRSGSQEVRRLVGDFFREWASSLTPTHLPDDEAMRRLLVLTETEPSAYLGILAALLTNSSQSSVESISNEAKHGRWGSRRHLVWIAERMAAFPEFFPQAESILLALALVETEPGIANNASLIWQQLFRIVLSGAALPFEDRITLLRQRLASGNKDIRRLATRAVESILVGLSHATRVAGPSVVAGRLTPPDWRPKTQRELDAAIGLAVTLLGELIASPDEELRQSGFRILAREVRALLSHGYLEPIKALLAQCAPPEDVLAPLLEGVDHFLRYDAESGRFRPAAADYVEAVRLWANALVPTTLHGRLVATVGKDRWHHSIQGGERAWQEEIAALAEELVEDEEKLRSELPWLLSPDAKSAGLLGEALGRADSRGQYLHLILSAPASPDQAALASGYVSGLVKNSPDLRDSVNSEIDGLERRNPLVAFNVLTSAPEATGALERSLRLVDAGHLPPEYLGVFIRSIPEAGAGRDLGQLLTRLLPALRSGNQAAARAAVDLAAYRLTVASQAKDAILNDSEALELIWSLLEETSSEGAGESYWWARSLEVLARLNVERAAKIASSALLGESLHLQDEARKVLLDLAKGASSVVMEQVGQRMLDPERGWLFFVRGYKELFAGIDEGAIKAWLDTSGAEGARLLARHVPSPYLDTTGTPVVPPLTEYVLETFEDDDRTFREFCAGVHAWRTYSGDIAAHHLAEATEARSFSGHRLRRIREWASLEARQKEQDAKWWQQHEEEFDLE